MIRLKQQILSKLQSGHFHSYHLLSLYPMYMPMAAFSWMVKEELEDRQLFGAWTFQTSDCCIVPHCHRDKTYGIWRATHLRALCKSSECSGLELLRQLMTLKYDMKFITCFPTLCASGIVAVYLHTKKMTQRENLLYSWEHSKFSTFAVNENALDLNETISIQIIRLIFKQLDGSEFVKRSLEFLPLELRAGCLFGTSTWVVKVSALSNALS